MTLVNDVERVQRLQAQEVNLREAGRHLELVPENRDEAARLFGKANGLRKTRLALLERMGLGR